MVALRQTNFGAGELSPYMWGRTDSPLYGRGLRRLRDFVLTQQGQAFSRPGTRYLDFTRAGGVLRSRLVPFLVSDTEGYLLEFGEAGFLRVWRNGAVVQSDIPFPIIGEALWQMTWAQSNDVMLLTVAGQPPVTVARTGLTTFTAVWGDSPPTPIAPQWQDVATQARTTVPKLVTTGGSLTAATVASPLREWQWYVSAVIRTAEGRVFETTASLVTLQVDVASSPTGVTSTLSTNRVALGPDRPVTVRRQMGVTDVWAGSIVHRVERYLYYRGRGNLIGYVGETSGDLDFVDVGDTPNYEVPPLLGANPLRVRRASGAFVQDSARAIAYHQQRLLLGGLVLRPSTLLASAQGNQTQFDMWDLPIKGQALEVELASRTRETVRHFLSLQALLTFTDGGVWSQPGALDPTEVNGFAPIAETGCSFLRPLVVQATALYARAKGLGVSALLPSSQAAGLFSYADVSTHAQHLFAAGSSNASELVDWDYQQQPFGLVWAVRRNGQLLTCTFNGEMAGWALHTTPGRVPAAWDRFESVAVVPEGQQDIVYVCCRRDNRFTIERFANRLRGTGVEPADDDAALDCHVRFDHPLSSGTSPLLNASSALEGRDVWLCAVGNNPVGPMRVTAGKVDLAAAGFRLAAANSNPGPSILGGALQNVVGFIGLRYQPELELLDVVSSEARTKQRTVVSVGVGVDESRGLFVGQSPDKLVEWTQRSSASGYVGTIPESQFVVIPVKGGFDRAGRAFIRQTMPLPLAVLEVVREVDFGG
jgi:hypothetical protein